MSKSPGVHIEYAPSHSLSVSASASMSVPVLIGPFVAKDAGEECCVAVDNWSEFVQKFDTDALTAAVKITSTPPESEPATDSLKAGEEEWSYSSQTTLSVNPAVEAVRLYFINGGGRCYILCLNLVSTLSGNQRTRDKHTRDNNALLAALPQTISGFPDITLLVWCGSDEQKSDVYQAVTELVSGLDKPYFLLTDTKDGDETVVLTDNANVGVWTPHVKTQWPPALPADENVMVAGYQTETGQEAETLTLLQLSAINQALYQTIKAQLLTQYTELSIREKERTFSPTPLVAGQFCRIESQRGVWSAPAGMAVTLQGISDLTQRFTDSESAALNAAGLNAIRYFHRPTAGFRVFGARTQQPDNDENRYR